ncbi:nickel-type superoxide dismutase maturation protease [Thalassotalea sp. PS06]|uniref:nickel-type superoxide dismutase maturation protease n=1 Tax=Thalassotalea sp. PS06 TaxID=2594005 RepID=UPI001163920A|nr:nickel-type superoxide dismutase maturation protease [Thalassotalea sp. PS06]QDP02307.1 nickel-type superoxide dismutase maturation protease [Thalassotalea sp. PS06]
MEPLLPDSSYLLCTSLLNFLPIKPEQQLVINHPEHGVNVKTVAMVDKNGLIWSRSENTQSLSVEQFGPVSKSQVLGRVLCVISAPN